MEIFLNIFYLAAGIAALYYGADFLIKGGVDIAERAGISPLVIGLTLVAFATSSPELAVSISSALNNNSDIAIGNVIGSNIANIGLILGACACIMPLGIDKQLLKFDVPVMIGVSLLTLIIYFVFAEFNRYCGIILIILLFAYMIWNIYTSRNTDITIADEKKNPRYPLYLAIIIIVVSLGVLIGGAKIFLLSAVYFAKLFNVSDAVIGLTVVAVGTSLPELATSIIATCKGQKDIAIGNVVGSNIFNLIGILGITAVIKPVNASGITVLDMTTMVLFAIFLTVFMFTGRRLNRIEGALLLAAYIVYSIFICL